MLEPRTMSLGMRIYLVAGVAFLVLCFALVAAMVVDTHLRPHGAGSVFSSVDAERGAD